MSLKCFWNNAFDLSKDINGEEWNIISGEILANLAKVKSFKLNSEEAFDLINKAKEIEAQILTINSKEYQEVIEIEHEIETNYHKSMVSQYIVISPNIFK